MVNGSTVSSSTVPVVEQPRSTALEFRRWCWIAAPVVAGALAIGGALAKLCLRDRVQAVSFAYERPAWLGTDGGCRGLNRPPGHAPEPG